MVRREQQLLGGSAPVTIRILDLKERLDGCFLAVAQACTERSECASACVPSWRGRSLLRIAPSRSALRRHRSGVRSSKNSQRNGHSAALRFPQLDFWTGVVSEWPVIRPQSAAGATTVLSTRVLWSIQVRLLPLIPRSFDFSPFGTVLKS